MKAGQITHSGTHSDDQLVSLCRVLVHQSGKGHFVTNGKVITVLQ